MAGSDMESPETPNPSEKDAPPSCDPLEVPPSLPRTHMDTSPIDPGHIEVLQVLNEHGDVDEAMAPDLEDRELLRVHRAMVLARAFDDRMFKMQRQGEMGTFAPNLGQEACMIGQVQPLTADDWFAPSYRAFGAQLWRGWTMEGLLRLWAGFHDGFPPPEGVNDLPFSIVIGSHVLPAVGLAMGMKYRGSSDCVLANFGDGATSQGATLEAFNWAAVHDAPIIFVCENNGWAISTPIDRQSGTDSLALRGLGFGMPSIRVDGNDVLAMIQAVRDAAILARGGGGPTLIEAMTYRMSLHTTADDPKVYRDDAEVEPWEERCPIRRLEIHLQRRSLLDAQSADTVREECDAEVLEARDRFRAMPPADPREIFDHLYGSIPPELQAQRDEYFRRLNEKGVN